MDDFKLRSMAPFEERMLIEDLKPIDIDRLILLQNNKNLTSDEFNELILLYCKITFQECFNESQFKKEDFPFVDTDSNWEKYNKYSKWRSCNESKWDFKSMWLTVKNFYYEKYRIKSLIKFGYNKALEDMKVK